MNTKDIESLKENLSPLEKYVPSGGYTEIHLHTKGKLGAPATFNVRNYSIDELIGLGLANDAETPKKQCEILRNTIITEGVDPADFHPGEVVELMLSIYSAYYSDELSLPYEKTEDDQKWIDENFPVGSEERKLYDKKMASEANNRIKIKIKDIKFYDIPEDAKFGKRFTKKSGWYAVFNWPKFGDDARIIDGVDRMFRERQRQYAGIEKKIQIQQQMVNQQVSGKAVNIDAIPIISQQEDSAYRDFMAQKIQYGIVLRLASHLTNVNGKDLSGSSLEERLTELQNAEFDDVFCKAVTKWMENMKIGPKKEMKVVNPYTQEVMDYTVPFRIDSLFEATRDADTNQIVESDE